MNIIILIIIMLVGGLTILTNTRQWEGLSHIIIMENKIHV